MPRDWKTSKYVKVVAMSPEDYFYILQTKGRKTLAGKLEQIIAAYRKDYPGKEKVVKK